MDKVNKIIDYIKILRRVRIEKLGIHQSVVNVRLDNKYNHLGDTLVFAPLVSGLIRSGYDVRVNDRYQIFKNLYGSGNVNSAGFELGRSYSNSERKRFSKNGNINFYAFPAGPIAKTLHNRYLDDSIYNDSLQDFKRRLFELSTRSNVLDSYEAKNNYIIISPAINSRRFGFNPDPNEVKEKFLQKVLEYHKKGVLIVKIGQNTLKNSKIDHLLDRLVNIDLTGKTHWFDLPSLFISERCLSIVTFDTFTYHLAVLLERPHDVFSKSWLNKYESEWIRSRFLPAF